MKRVLSPLKLTFSESCRSDYLYLDCEFLPTELSCKNSSPSQNQVAPGHGWGTHQKDGLGASESSLSKMLSGPADDG